MQIPVASQPRLPDVYHRRANLETPRPGLLQGAGDRRWEYLLRSVDRRGKALSEPEKRSAQTLQQKLSRAQAAAIIHDDDAIHRPLTRLAGFSRHVQDVFRAAQNFAPGGRRIAKSKIQKIP